MNASLAFSAAHAAPIATPVAVTSHPVPYSPASYVRTDATNMSPGSVFSDRLARAGAAALSGLGRFLAPAVLCAPAVAEALVWESSGSPRADNDLESSYVNLAVVGGCAGVLNGYSFLISIIRENTFAGWCAILGGGMSLGVLAHHTADVRDPMLMGVLLILTAAFTLGSIGETLVDVTQSSYPQRQRVPATQSHDS